MKLLIVICDREYAPDILKTLNLENVKYHLSFYGQGTANQKILTYFGLEKTEKEVILSFIDKQNVTKVMDHLMTHEYIRKHGAVAFTVPLDGISRSSWDYLKTMEEHTK